MKTIICTFLLLVGAIGQSFSQDKGQFWIGGNIDVTTNDVHEQRKDTNYSIEPEFGYAFSDKWAAGLGIGFGRNKSTYDPEYYSGDRKEVQNTFSMRPFARYTFFTWRAVKLFADGGFLYARAKAESVQYYTDGENETDRGWHSTRNTYGVFISPGISLHLGRSVALTGKMNLLNAYYYKSTTAYNYESADQETHGFNFGANSPFNLSSFSVGFNYCF